MLLLPPPPHPPPVFGAPPAADKVVENLLHCQLLDQIVLWLSPENEDFLPALIYITAILSHFLESGQSCPFLSVSLTLSLSRSSREQS